MARTLLNKTEGFFYILEPNLGASVATIIYSRPGETPVGIRSTLGLLNEDQFQGIRDDLKVSSEKLRFMAISAKGRCQAAAQTDEDMKWALGEVGGELQICSAYFAVCSRCIKPPEAGPCHQLSAGVRQDRVIGILKPADCRCVG